MVDLTGKRIIVTGGASGMGQSIVEAFPRLGAHIVSLDINAEAGEAIAKAAEAEFIPCNVADEDSVKSAIGAAAQRLGGLDVLVHAAGIVMKSPAEEIPLDAWSKIMAINATGTYLTNVAAFPYLKANGGGAVVNFASVAGAMGLPGKAHYAATKGAVLAWSRTLATEWGPYNIRVNAVAPAIWTPMYDYSRSLLTPEELKLEDEAKARAIPLGGKMGNPERDFVPVMAFLCSDDSRFITGQTISIDGGMLMVR